MREGTAKTGVFAVRVSDEERETIERAARFADKPVTQWARDALLAKAKEERPKFGMLRGKKILLAEAEEKLSEADLVQVLVEMPDGRVVRPWRFVGTAFTDENGKLIVI